MIDYIGLWSKSLAETMLKNYNLNIDKDLLQALIWKSILEMDKLPIKRGNE